jgi:hypothetical protein
MTLRQRMGVKKTAGFYNESEGNMPASSRQVHWVVSSLVLLLRLRGRVLRITFARKAATSRSLASPAPSDSGYHHGVYCFS